MANDINLAISGNIIKNGSTIVTCSPLGEYSSISEDALNTPTIADIQSKYDNRFDDPRYYTGDDPA